MELLFEPAMNRVKAVSDHIGSRRAFNDQLVRDDWINEQPIVTGIFESAILKQAI